MLGTSKVNEQIAHAKPVSSLLEDANILILLVEGDDNGKEGKYLGLEMDKANKMDTRYVLGFSVSLCFFKNQNLLQK